MGRRPNRGRTPVGHPGHPDRVHEPADRDDAPGEFRKTQNWIGPDGATIEQATFVPPPVPEMEAALAELESFLHRQGHYSTLIEVGLAHAQFETIHPFLDGNGRVGRLLNTFL